MFMNALYVQICTMAVDCRRRPYGGAVRWEAMFADMEAQLDAAESRSREDEVAELTRAERATVRLCDRLRAAVGTEIRLSLRSGVLRAVAVDVGSTWLLVSEADREHRVPLPAIGAVAALGSTSAPDPGLVVRSLGLGHVLRAIARDRTVVHVTGIAGTATGRIDAVGADHVDIAVVYADSGRPTGERHVVPFDALDLVSSR